MHRGHQLPTQQKKNNAFKINPERFGGSAPLVQDENVFVNIEKVHNQSTVCYK